jgi:hypothetical protein
MEFLVFKKTLSSLIDIFHFKANPNNISQVHIHSRNKITICFYYGLSVIIEFISYQNKIINIYNIVKMRPDLIKSTEKHKN